MIVALFSIPILIRGLGKERFGVLTLAWALIGYASLFDFGLGRALTQLVAKKLGAGEKHEVPSLAWTSLLLMLLLGLVGATILLGLSPWLVHRTLNVPVGLQAETLRSFYLLGISIPVVILTTGLRGLLEAHQRFDLINTLRVPMGVYSFASPLVVLPFSRSLVPVVGILVVGRLLACVAHLLLCFKVSPELASRIAWHRHAAGPLLRFGSWMTITNIISPLMVTLDRFLIGALISVTAVAYYATPYEVATKFSLITGALVSVMFPAFSAASAQDHNRMTLLFDRTVKCLLVVLFPLVLLTVVLAQDGLKLWLGADFAQNSFRVLQWLSVGVFLNSLAQAPFWLLQGVGRPDLTAKLQLIELPAYAIALYWLTKAYGVQGTAIAWTARVGIDALLLFVLTKRFLPFGASFRLHSIFMAAAALITLALAALPQGLVSKSIFLTLTILGFVVLAWFLILSAEERKLGQNVVRSLQRKVQTEVPAAAHD